MMQNAKTIQIYLPSGDPLGIRVAEFTTRIVRLIEVPRKLVGDFLKMPAAQQVGVYFLFGDAGDADGPQLYIGQSGTVGDRLANHDRDKNKEFWNRALVAIARTQSLTTTHSLFLEWMSIREAAKVGRYTLENGNAGTQPHTPEPLQAECVEIYETIGMLLSTLGYPVFTPVIKKSVSVGQDGEQELFFCKGSGANGTGLYTEEGFVVLKGSTGRLENVPSLKGSTLQFRQRLIDGGVTRAEGDSMVFVKDHLFNSPSMAAISLLGRSANGWLEWRDKNGKTLDELKRQATA